MYTRQQFREADRGVSPVIGVILMIAITVVIATATGTLVLQLVDDRTSELEAGDVEAEFSVSYGTDTVTVTHAGGDDLTDRNTDSVALAVTDTDTDATTRVLWADEASLPVTEGDSFTVDDPTVDSNGDDNYLDADGSVGFYLEPGDTVEVVWTGRRLGAPETQTETLETLTVGNATG